MKLLNKVIFYDSTLWYKLEELLLVYYLYDSDKTVRTSEYFYFPIQGFQFLKFIKED
ncbi:MutH/Sau3AI family endonuclease [Streptococcus anginosus]|uniref:MutH/Sau3AI family endonuclease n=1 Tax=Streptococcus anginosus TaxID=1328 RepID=UPI003CE50AB3